MDIAIWIAQGVLGLMFLMAGIMKLTMPKEKVAEKAGAWANDFSPVAIKMIGLVELLGALGIVLPMALNIIPELTIAATSGLILTMIVAAGIHAKRKEKKEIGVNVMLLSVAVFVLVGRVYLESII